MWEGLGGVGGGKRSLLESFEVFRNMRHPKFYNIQKRDSVNRGCFKRVIIKDQGGILFRYPSADFPSFKNLESLQSHLPQQPEQIFGLGSIDHIFTRRSLSEGGVTFLPAEALAKEGSHFHKMNRFRVTTLSHFVIGYMILAFGWWSFHLWRQNDRVFDREKQLIELRSPGDLAGNSASYIQAEKTWQSGRRMVVAEGLFFTLCLVWGLWIIRRSAAREVSLARQRRNFLLSITHELKSPIASMRLVLETLIKRNLSPEQRAPLLSNGLKDADRLQSLVESLLLGARLEDNWRPHHEMVSFEALAVDVLDSLRVRFPEADFRLNIPEGLPTVQADKMGLSAILQNLLENAQKYSPEGTPIELSAAQVGSKLQFSVADQGQGIPDAEKQSVFDKFYRMGNEETRQSTGTGLGLYIVNQVLKAHGGRVQITDNQPRGTVFTVEI